MRVLIIEDQKNIRTTLKAFLEKECYAVDAAEDGEKGSYLARVNDYDIVLLDIVLPKKDGLTVCKEIRAERKEMPILVLSVKTKSEMKTELLNAGADDYLDKPFSFDELIARIRALLRRPRQMAGEVLRIGTLTLDTKNHIARHGAADIPLTKKEFSLLEYLMRNRGITVSRGMLMEHVWDQEIDPFSNTIESHIASLRKKLDQKNSKKYIETVTGRGYRFHDPT